MKNYIKTSPLKYHEPGHAGNGTLGGETPSYIYGCTNPNAINYNPQANYDDGSCVLPTNGGDNGGEQPIACNKSRFEVCRNSLQLRWGMELRINDQQPIPDIPVYIEYISYSGTPGNITATLQLSEDIDNMLSEGQNITFHGDRNLNFHPDRKITGLNVIDGMIFWTDNHSEPKKVNIERGKIGSRSWLYGAGWDGSESSPEPYTWNQLPGPACNGGDVSLACYSDFDQHTKLIILEEHVMECEKSTSTCYIYGCTNPNAFNYNPQANYDDGSCQLPIPDVFGCDDGSVANVSNVGACNTGMTYWSAAATGNQYDYNLNDTNLCIFPDDCEVCDGSGGVMTDPNCAGCTDPNANDYDPNAVMDCLGNNINDSNYVQQTGWNDCCDIVVYGCMDPNATNYLATATDPCDGTYMGCPTMINWTLTLCTGPGNGLGDCCEYASLGDSGCTDPAATNYDPNASFDDGSCEYSGDCNNCNFDPNVTNNTELVKQWTSDPNNASVPFQTIFDCVFPCNGTTDPYNHSGSSWPVNYDPEKVRYGYYRPNDENPDISQANWPYEYRYKRHGGSQWEGYFKLLYIGVEGVPPATINYVNGNGGTPLGWRIWPPGPDAPQWDVNNPLLDALRGLHTNSPVSGALPTTYTHPVVTSGSYSHNLHIFPSIQGQAPAQLSWSDGGIVIATNTVHNSTPQFLWGTWSDAVSYINEALRQCYADATGRQYLIDSHAAGVDWLLEFDAGSQDFETVKFQIDPLLNATKKPYEGYIRTVDANGVVYNIWPVGGKMGGIDRADSQNHLTLLLANSHPGGSMPNANLEAHKFGGNYATNFTSTYAASQGYTGGPFPFFQGAALEWGATRCFCGITQTGPSSGAPINCNPDPGQGYCPSCSNSPPCSNVQA